MRADTAPTSGQRPGSLRVENGAGSPAWFSADLHLGHERISELAGRPFRTVGAMNEAIIASWNSLVGANDEVWVLGDLAMGKIDESLALLARLAGRIVLVPGNHDRCSPLRGSGSASWSERYRRAGIARIEPGPVRMEVAGRAVLADHFPYRFQDEDVADPNARPERYPEAHPVDNGQWLLHGHVHERWRQRGRMVNVGVDAWGGRPVSADELAAIMDRGARRLGCLEWKVSELAS